MCSAHRWRFVALVSKVTYKPYTAGYQNVRLLYRFYFCKGTCDYNKRIKIKKSKKKR